MNQQRNTYEYQTMRSLKRKLYLINLRGGKCENCPYDKNLATFDFHHIDPTTKKFQLDQRTLSNTSWKLILEEFEKCKVLCSNCHREHHFPELSINIIIKKISNYDESKNKWIEIKVDKKYNCEDCDNPISKWGKKCKKCLSISQRKVERPDKHFLIDEVTLNGYSKIARKYGVSDKTIKNWINFKY